MLAYHNDPALKEKIINQLQMHYDHDEIVQGIYWENGKGCAVGCIMERDNNGNIHKEMQDELGIIQPLPRLIDRIFECLDNKEAKEFPLKIMSAIPVGKDLSNVWPKFAVFILTDQTYGVSRLAKNYATKKAIISVSSLYQRKIEGEVIENSEWIKVYAAADAAADAADADAAAYAAYAADAAYAAAAAADDAAAYAAYAAAADAAYAAAYAAHFKIMADKLIELVGQ